MESIRKEKRELRVKHINLFEFLLDHLEEQGYLAKSLEIQSKKGDVKLFDALIGLLNVEKSLLPRFHTVAQPDHHNLVLVSGVGSVYPLLRTSGSFALGMAIICA